MHLFEFICTTLQIISLFNKLLLLMNYSNVLLKLLQSYQKFVFSKQTYKHNVAQTPTRRLNMNCF